MHTCIYFVKYHTRINFRGMHISWIIHFCDPIFTNINNLYYGAPFVSKYVHF